MSRRFGRYCSGYTAGQGVREGARWKQSMNCRLIAVCCCVWCRSVIAHRASVLADDLAGKRSMRRHGYQSFSARQGSRAGLTLWGARCHATTGAPSSNATTALVTFVRHPFYFPQRLGLIIYTYFVVTYNFQTFCHFVWCDKTDQCRFTFVGRC